MAKLVRRGYDDAEADTAVGALAAQGLVDDARFAAGLVRTRTERGSGPLRIRRDLQARGIDGAIIAACVVEDDEEWIAGARRARAKRFGEAPPAGAGEHRRQARFLAGRGFSPRQIRRALEIEDMGTK